MPEMDQGTDLVIEEKKKFLSKKSRFWNKDPTQAEDLPEEENASKSPPSDEKIDNTGIYDTPGLYQKNYTEIKKLGEVRNFALIV